jgi:short-subunit dehydrogenase
MWRDRRVIVAGGTAGFGLVLARHLARAGARVLIVGRSSDGVRRALEACERAGVPTAALHGIAADLGRAGEGNRVAGEALRLLGGIDDLVSCVGRSGRGRILDTSDDLLRDYLAANLFSATELTRAVADDVAAARGHVIFIGSLAGKVVTPFMGPYAVAKSALAAYTDAVRLELAPRGAHVLLVSPGPIRRTADDPAADRAVGRYADEAAAAGLPDAATAPGGSARLGQLDADRLAARVLEACRRRSCELVVPRKVGLLAGFIEWFPNAGRRLLARFTAAVTIAIALDGAGTIGAGEPSREEEIRRGSETAKGGFRNEEDVCDRFNRWREDPDGRAWLAILHGGTTDVTSVRAATLHGEKADVEVRITTPAGETRHGISIKLVSNAEGFNQIDKRRLAVYTAMWDMPADVRDALALFVGESPPTAPGRSPERMFLTELPPAMRQSVVEFFTRHRAAIVSDLFAGDGPHAAGWFLVTRRGDAARSVLIPTAEAAAFFGAGDVALTPAGNLRIGRITMQRKGGDNGRDTARMLQFKIDPTDLLDRAESGSLAPGSRPFAEPERGVGERVDGTGS